jgi:hypothetical protein
MSVFDTAVDKARLLAPVDEDETVDNAVGRTARRFRQLWTRLPGVCRWIVYVDPGNASRIPATDRPDETIDDYDRQMITRSRQLSTNAPALIRRIDQHTI